MERFTLRSLKKYLVRAAAIFVLTGLFSAQVWAAPEMAVSLVDGQYSAAINSEVDFTVWDGVSGKTVSLKKGKYFLNGANGMVNIGGKTFNYGVVLKLTDDKKIFTVNRQQYRGALQILAGGGGSTLAVNNLVSLEDYVNSVLGPKSSPVWPDEAIKAQAVAVRSLAWYKQSTRDGSYAVKANDKDLFYGGANNEIKSVNKVAALTSGEILYYQGRPAQTYSCESSGGQTEDSVNVLGYSLPYLHSVQDYDQDCPSFKWTKNLTVANVGRILEQNGYVLGTLESYRLSALSEPYAQDRSSTGRVRYVYFKGSSGSVTIEGAKLAGILALSSNLFEMKAATALPDKLDVPIANRDGYPIGHKEIPIEITGKDEPRWKQVIPGYVFLSGSKDENLVFTGRGIGDGLGLSKWGAKGLADQAPAGSVNYYREILQHYYPGTELSHIN